jgi:hypothetical protein
MCATLKYQPKTSLKTYLTVAGGSLPNFPIGEGVKNSVAADSDGNAVNGKEGRFGIQYVTDAKTPAKGHSLAFQAQVYSGDKFSFGGYVTGHFTINPAWAIHGSARAFSLEDDLKLDRGAYIAANHKFSESFQVAIYGSWVSRSKDEVAGDLGNAGIDVSGAPLPDNGIMKEESRMIVQQFGAELVFQITKTMKFKLIQAFLRTSPEVGNKEFTQFRDNINGVFSWGL